MHIYLEDASGIDSITQPNQQVACHGVACSIAAAGRFKIFKWDVLT